MTDIFSTLFAVLLVAFAGHILWRRKFVPVTFWDGLSKICYWILFPCLLFNLVSTLNLNAPFIIPFVVTISISSAVAFAFGFFSGWLLNVSGPTTSSRIHGSLRLNSFLMLAFVPGGIRGNSSSNWCLERRNTCSNYKRHLCASHFFAA